jgi:hypothetical protein
MSMNARNAGVRRVLSRRYRPPQLAASFISNQTHDVACWHETDLPPCPQFGRYRGESGHGGYGRRLPSLTLNRHKRHIPPRRTPGADRAVYLVLDEFGQLGRAWRETR